MNSELDTPAQEPPLELVRYDDFRLSPIGVHGVQVLVGQLQSGGVIGSSADDFDVAGRVALAGPFQGTVEFAERRNLCGEPVIATEGRRERVIVPLGQIVVFPIGVVLRGRVRSRSPGC